MKSEYTLLVFFAGIVVTSTLIGLSSELPFLDWAWMRHQNMLSYHVRPLLVILLGYYSYRKNTTGIIVMIISLCTCAYWFPQPAPLSSEVFFLISNEKFFLYSTWNLNTILILLCIPTSITFFIYGLWNRSLLTGLIGASGIVLIKVFWSVFQSGSSKAMTLPFVIGGLVAVNLIANLLYRIFYKKYEKILNRPFIRQHPRDIYFP